MSKRIWVLQECFLATHTLHFTNHGMFSSTPGGVPSESILLKFTSLTRAGATFFGPSALPQLRAILTDAKKPDRPGLTTFIFNGKRLYNVSFGRSLYEGDLTGEEGKLFAISDIPRRVQSSTSSNWLAALWSDQISEGLFWILENGLSPLTNSRAPSWSWAAWDGPVQNSGIVKAAAINPRARFMSIHRTHST